MKIGIIGTGKFSLSVALLLATNKNNRIGMWSENKKLVAQFHKSRKLDILTKKQSIPENIVISSSYEDIVIQADVLFLMTSIVYLEEVTKDIVGMISKNVPLIIGTKGINNDLFVHQIVKKYAKNPILILSGPTFSFDVATLEPIGFCLACENKKYLKQLETLFWESSAYVETSQDIMGVAICGSLKNVYAIGAGILDGLSCNESTMALYLTRCFQEIRSILNRFGNASTLFGLSGFGDFVLTCTSKNSRNFAYGELVGKNVVKKELDTFIKQNTVEGLVTAKSMYSIFKRKHMHFLILDTLYSILCENFNPKELQNILKKED